MCQNDSVESNGIRFANNFKVLKSVSFMEFWNQSEVKKWKESKVLFINDLSISSKSKVSFEKFDPSLRIKVVGSQVSQYIKSWNQSECTSSKDFHHN